MTPEELRSLIEAVKGRMNQLRLAESKIQQLLEANEVDMAATERWLVELQEQAVRAMNPKAAAK